jgi:hypothetical protein
MTSNDAIFAISRTCFSSIASIFMYFMIARLIFDRHWRMAFLLLGAFVIGFNILSSLNLIALIINIPSVKAAIADYYAIFSLEYVSTLVYVPYTIASIYVIYWTGKRRSAQQGDASEPAKDANPASRPPSAPTR